MRASPSFPPSLEWYQDGWLLGLARIRHAEIRSGVLFVAWPNAPSRYVTGAFADLLDGVSKEDLHKNLERIVGRLVEDVPATGAQQAGAAGAVAARPAPRAVRADALHSRFSRGARPRGRDRSGVRARPQIRQMIDILARRRKTPYRWWARPASENGRFEGLALKIVEGDVPSVLAGVDLLGLDLGLPPGRSRSQREFENGLRRHSEVKESAKPIFFSSTRPTHDRAAARPAEGMPPTAETRASRAGELRTIAATTWSSTRSTSRKEPGARTALPARQAGGAGRRGHHPHAARSARQIRGFAQGAHPG